jgi:hypothetical protein
MPSRKMGLPNSRYERTRETQTNNMTIVDKLNVIIISRRSRFFSGVWRVFLDEPTEVK